MGRYGLRMTPISFKRHRFSPVIIQHAVWLYARFTLSFRDVEDLLAERGIDVSNETVRRWFLKFERLVAVNLRRGRPRDRYRRRLARALADVPHLTVQFLRMPPILPARLQ